MASLAKMADVFADFKLRRAAIIKALTKEADEFYQLCDPRNENLCLYGLPSGKWAVRIPVEQVPSELPEPALGINFARDEMERKKWLSLVAVHSDSWLLAVAFYYGANHGFQKTERAKLFELINDLPTVYDVVNMKVNPAKAGSYRTKSRKTHPFKAEQPKAAKRPKEEYEREPEGGEEMAEQSLTLCAACNIDYANEEFWILCDICEKWYHGKCVRVTLAKAANIKEYVCPACSKQRQGKSMKL